MRLTELINKLNLKSKKFLYGGLVAGILATGYGCVTKPPPWVPDGKVGQDQTEVDSSYDIKSEDSELSVSDYNVTPELDVLEVSGDTYDWVEELDSLDISYDTKDVTPLDVLEVSEDTYDWVEELKELTCDDFPSYDAACGLNGNGTQKMICHDVEEDEAVYKKFGDCEDLDNCVKDDVKTGNDCAYPVDGSCVPDKKLLFCEIVADTYDWVEEEGCGGNILPEEICSNGIDEDCNGIVDDKIAKYDDNGDVVEEGCMTLIEEGLFKMGCNPAKHSCSGDDFQHTVQLSAYAIDLTEVPVKVYQACVADGGCSLPSSLDSYSHEGYYNDPAFEMFPVINVNKYQAEEFCNWAGKRLPTEAEWEKAARGDDERKYPWGDGNPDCWLTNYNWCFDDVQEVFSHPTGESPYHVLNMAGNVSEWVSDWYSLQYYNNSPLENPQGPEEGNMGVIRSGNFTDDTKFITTFLRTGFNQGWTKNYIGFRCVKDLEE